MFTLLILWATAITLLSWFKGEMLLSIHNRTSLLWLQWNNCQYLPLLVTVITLKYLIWKFTAFSIGDFAHPRLVQQLPCCGFRKALKLLFQLIFTNVICKLTLILGYYSLSIYDVFLPCISVLVFGFSCLVLCF